MGGYNEIQNRPERYGLIDVPYLRALCGFSNPEHFTEQYRQWVQEAIDQGQNQRESCWTETIAVGRVGFVDEIKAGLGAKGIGRRVERQEAVRFVLKEEFEAYSADSEPKNGRLILKNSFFWMFFRQIQCLSLVRPQGHQLPQGHQRMMSNRCDPLCDLNAP